MISYRSNVHELAMSVSSEAMAFSLELSECLSLKHMPNYQDEIVGYLTRLQRLASSIRNASEKLMAVLPQEVNSKIRGDGEGLVRHLNFIDYWLSKRQPEWCKSDPISIVNNDIPLVLRWFDEWYDHRSPQDDDLYIRLTPLISSGQMNSALREAWPIFKTRMVTSFTLSEHLDGHSLADALFGSQGATANILPENERKGYLDLFKGLYTLFRNPVTHNDIPSNPAETDAVLTLVNSALVKIEQAHRNAALVQSDRINDE